MNEKALKEFKKVIEEQRSLFVTDSVVRDGARLSEEFEYSDLVPVLLMNKSRELFGWVVMNFGIETDQSIGGCTIPFNIEADGKTIPTAIVLVAKDSVNAFTEDPKEREIFLRSAFAHELTHVKQLFNMGVEKFTSASYNVTGDGVDKSSYLNNVLEKEAHSVQNAYLKRHGIDKILGEA